MSSRRSTPLAQRYLAAIRNNEDSKKASTQDSINRGKTHGEKVIENSASQHQECASLMPIPNSEHVEMEELTQSRNGSTSPSRIRYVRGFSSNEEVTRRDSNGSMNNEDIVQNHSNHRNNESLDHMAFDIPKWKRTNTFTTNRFASTLTSHGREHTTKSAIRAASPALTDISDPATEVTDNRGKEKIDVVQGNKKDASSPKSTEAEKRSKQPWQRRKLKISNDQGWIKINRNGKRAEEKMSQTSPEESQLNTGDKQDSSQQSEEDTMAENDVIEQHPTSPQHKSVPSESSTSEVIEKISARCSNSISRQGAVMFGQVKLKSIHRKVMSTVDDVEIEARDTRKEETSANKTKKHVGLRTPENSIHPAIPTGKEIIPGISESKKVTSESDFISVKARLKSWNTKGREVTSSSSTLKKTSDKPVNSREKLKTSNREVIVDELTDESCKKNSSPKKEMRATEKKKVIHNQRLKDCSESGKDREDMGDKRMVGSNDNEKAKFSWEKKIERRQIFGEKVKETITVESFIPTKTYLVNSSKSITEIETKTKNEDYLIDNGHAKFSNTRRAKVKSSWQKHRGSDNDDTQAISRSRSLLTKRDDTTLESNAIKVDEAHLDPNIQISNSVKTKFDAFNKYQQSLRSSSLSRSPKATAKQQNNIRSKSLSISPKLNQRKVASVPSYTTNIIDKTVFSSSVNEQDSIKVSNSTNENMDRRYSKQSSRKISTKACKVQHKDATKTLSQPSVISRDVGSRPASKGFQSLRSRFEAMSKGQHQSKTNIENASVWCKADSVVPSTETPKEVHNSILVDSKDCDDKQNNAKGNLSLETDSNAKGMQSPSTFNLRDNSPVQFVDGPSTFLNSSFHSQNGNIHMDKTFHRPSASAFTKFSNPTKNIVESQINSSKEHTSGTASPPNDIPWKYIEPNDIPWTDRELLEARERSFEEERNRSFVTQQPDVNFSYGAEYLDYSFEDDDCDGVTLCPTISDVSSLSIPSCIQTIESSSIITDPSQTSDECTRTVESASEKQSTTLGLSEASSSQTSEAATPLIYSTLGKMGMKFATSSDHTGTTNTYRPEFNGLINTLPPIELNEHEEIEEHLFSTVQGETDQFTRNQFEKELKIQNEPQWKNDFFAVDSVKSHPTADSGDASGWVDFPTSVGGFSEQSSVDKTKKAMKVLSKKSSDQGTFLAQGQQRSSRGNNIRNRLIQSRLTKSTSASTVSQTEKSPNSEHASEKQEKSISKIPKPQSSAAYRRFNLDKVRAFQRNRRSLAE